MSLEELIRKHTYQVENGRWDICPIYRDRESIKQLVTYLAQPFAGRVDYVAAPEPLGFILGSMVADELGVGFIPIRNGFIDRVPEEDAIRSNYIDHNDRPRALQVRRSNLPEGSRILLVDDWIQTAATMQCCLSILEDADAELIGIASLGAEYNDATQRMFDTGLLHCVMTIYK